MAKGMPGADSSTLVTNQIGGRNLIELATTLFGTTPVVWGRYFTSVGTTGVVEYRHLRENQPLRANNIRVLPIARQTGNVNGTVADGGADATANAEDLIQTFGADYLSSQGGQVLMFLDVEGAPSLSAPYYRGWAATLLERALTSLRSEFEQSGKLDLFQRLKVFVWGDKCALSYAEMAVQLNMTEGAVKVSVHRLRQRYGELLRAEVAQTVSTPDEVNEELRYLLSVIRDGLAKSGNLGEEKL